MRFKAPSEITRDYKSFKRFLVILETTAAYGFHDLAEHIHPLKKRLWQEHVLTGKSRPEKLRMLFEEIVVYEPGELGTSGMDGPSLPGELAEEVRQHGGVIFVTAADMAPQAFPPRWV